MENAGCHVSGAPLTKRDRRDLLEAEVNGGAFDGRLLQRGTHGGGHGIGLQRRDQRMCRLRICETEFRCKWP